MTAKNILVVGISVQDYIFYVDEMPDGDSKTKATDFYSVGGGIAANAAVAIQKLGGKATLVSPIGKDSIGAEILDDLRSFSVDVSKMVVREDRQSPKSAIIQAKNGERLLVNHRSDDLFDLQLHDSVIDSMLDDKDAVLADIRWPKAALQIFKRATELGIPTILDYDGLTTEEEHHLLEYTSHAIFAKWAYEAAAKTHEKMDFANQFQAITDGGNGTRYRMGGQEWQHFPAISIDAVDTTGAGDVFHGAFALGFAETDDPIQALALANIAAAIKCTRKGGRTGFATRKEVDNFQELTKF